MIATITNALVRLYTDTGQVQAQIQFLTHRGKPGTIIGDPANTHMQALLKRAKREGLRVKAERW